MDITFDKHSDHDLVKLSGRFTFVDHAAFKEMVETLLKSDCQKCVLDLSGIEFVDSAGLGMLLIIKDELGKKDIPLVLSKPSGQVEKMIKVSHFDQLFTIES